MPSRHLHPWCLDASRKSKLLQYFFFSHLARQRLPHAFRFVCIDGLQKSCFPFSTFWQVFPLISDVQRSFSERTHASCYQNSTSVMSSIHRWCLIYKVVIIYLYIRNLNLWANCVRTNCLTLNTLAILRYNSENEGHRPTLTASLTGPQYTRALQCSGALLVQVEVACRDITSRSFPY